LLAQSGHYICTDECPLLGVKRTWQTELKFSTFDKMQATRTTSINRGKMLSLGDRFVPHIVPRDGFYCEESWSGWQDFNLRPPRPKRSTRPPYSVPTIGATLMARRGMPSCPHRSPRAVPFLDA